GRGTLPKNELRDDCMAHMLKIIFPIAHADDDSRVAKHFHMRLCIRRALLKQRGERVDGFGTLKEEIQRPESLRMRERGGDDRQFVVESLCHPNIQTYV